MHDFLVGFVCFVAGGFFVVVVGFISLRGQPGESDPAPQVTDQPSVERERWRRREPDPHPAWPACDCPSEAFHTKYYPSAGRAGQQRLGAAD
jgi:hypothetical protein